MKKLFCFFLLQWFESREKCELCVLGNCVFVLSKFSRLHVTRKEKNEEGGE